MTARRVRVLVSGEVQGVFFRWTCRKEAERLGLGGFVRNLPDGEVEAVFEGEPNVVDAMVEWCRHGPAGANVASIDVEEQPVAGDREFRITR